MRAVADGGERRLFAVENASGAAECRVVVPGNFEYAAVRRDVALQNDKAAGRLQRIVEIVYDFLFRGFLGRPRFFADGPARDRQAVAVQQLGVEQSPCNDRRSTRVIQGPSRRSGRRASSRPESASAC